MNVAVIQPPLMQLNTAYPSGAYLKSFFQMEGHKAFWYELNICLFYKIFSKEGLSYIFNQSQRGAQKKICEAQKSGDEETAEQLRRYLSQSDQWINWIDSITAILSHRQDFSSRELCHKFVFSPFAPRGMRMEKYLANLDHDLTIDDSVFLASLALADLADYIQFVFDKDFSLVRYAESLTVSESSFSQIEKGLKSPVLNHFYKKVLEEKFGPGSDFEKIINESSSDKNLEDKVLVCISIPFPGTFTPALYTASYLKECYGNKVFIAAGGGFINTELRDISDPSVGKYFDAISYDRGYGSYKKLFENHLDKSIKIYKMRFFDGEKITEPLWKDSEIELYENKITREIVPDYSQIDFNIYPRMADDVNPMQRMWSDGAWMKAYLAHGCYWHRCDFCDVNLDYVCAYQVVNVEKLFQGLSSQCKQKGLYGIHFVDEALPASALKKFSLLNSRNQTQLSYWGNVRFEKTFTHDLVALLSYSGLIGVSAGIEIATSDGLDNIHKGTSLDSIVGACCAFKEAGVLVHAYMIYGYWNEDDQDTINSMETLRQFYKAGLLDSSFWHKFVLTRNSRIYGEYEQGLHPNLKPLESKDGGVFAKNTMHFKGEEKSAKFHNGLNAALENWMHGQGLDKKVNKWFSFPTPEPTVSKSLVEDAISRYEERCHQSACAPLVPEKLYWLGGKILEEEIYNEEKKSGRIKLSWFYMQECEEVEVKLSSETAQKFTQAVYDLRPEVHDISKIQKLLEGPSANQIEKYLFRLRQSCLIMI